MLKQHLKHNIKVPLPKVSAVKKEHHFPLYKVLTFVIVFGSIGTYLLYSSFASTSTGTFGKTAIGSTCDTFTNDWKRVNKYSVGATVAVSKLSIYLKPGTVSGAQPIKGILYADNNGAPGSLIAATNQLLFHNTDSAGWYSLPFANPQTLNSGNYWIGVMTGSPARVAGYCYDIAAANVRDYNTNTFTSGPSNPFGSNSQDNRAMSLYASYSSQTSNTFGITTVGSQCDTFTNDWKRVNKYGINEAITISQLNLYLMPGSANGSQLLRGVLYADNNGAPGSLIAATNQLTYYNSNSAGWYNLTFAAPPTVNSGNYWIGVLTGNTARVAGYCYDVASANVRDYNTNADSSGPSSSFGSISQDNRAMSLNATYTLAGSPPPPPSGPKVNLTANPTAVNPGQTTTLSWSSTNTTECTAAWTGSKSTSGNQLVSPLTTTTYSMTCTGPGGSASASTTVSVSASGGGSPSVTLTASPVTINSGQSSTLSWLASNASSCAANWTASHATTGSQIVSPGATTVFSMSCTGTGGNASANVTVNVNSSGGGIACKSTLTGSQTMELQNNAYHLQSNEWGSSAPFSICTDGGVDFKIVTSGINNSTSGAPGAYPSLYKGCHWGYCTANSWLPLPVSPLVSTTNKVTTGYNTTIISGNAWDDAYDNWYNPNPSTNSNNTGLEMMIWINHNGPIQPAGSKVSTNALIDGMSWTVWHGGSSPGGTVSYVLNTPTTSVTNLDLGPFSADSLQRGYLTNSWYLIDVEAGFEPWQGGAGLSANTFDVTVH